MMSKVGMKFAVSAAAIAMTMVACSPSARAFRPNSASHAAAKSDQQAASAYAKANGAVRKGDVAEALRHAEQAVELAPRDVGYRMLLADLYLKNGRFQSAETSFGDVLTLDPGNARASLSIALARIALGRTGAAIETLDRLAETASPADIGLAYALAGEPRRAIEMLEPAAREAGATGRVRQNLALAYALAGDWQKARTTAAQDVSPAELGTRMQQWAAFAQPSGPATQVASLLGVTPAEDSGQPVRLALVQPETPTTAYAAAEPAPQPEPVQQAVVASPEPAPVQVASAEIPQWVSARETQTPVAAPEPQEETKPVFAQAVQSLVTPQPAVIRASAPKVQVQARSFDAAPSHPAVKPHAATRGTGRFVVQLGAFTSPAGVERAWASAYKRYGFGNHTPLSTTISTGKGKFHRLSVAGYDSHADASRVCQSVRSKGGACFVRALAGDAPVQWAWRYTGRKA